ncbi:Carboxypeptidase S-like protein [Hapsidospora chrysogenum ATCC 11550]|uniref:Carboxypeptidase S-like protein n=1 Tax=Hapsidospora chrysogenum (strain ATCC 11550 / CBS 779.69 / DSM 880 / IAM 14645 / JCM 23072 / IMI 49137) TaxID=857340 RepID=A0A086SZJ8_HAPC1|nr:Carboxypeptidase S-like protein [Hapsidospora chrysogenum ATCC 11550]
MSGQKEQHGTGLSSLVARGAVLAALASALLVVVDTPLKSFISSSLDYFSLHVSSSTEYDLSGVCQQVPGLSPRNHDAERFIRDKVESPAYHTEIINKLTRIIQIPSESYDDLGPIGEDDRWDVFYDMEKYIKATYPTLVGNVRLDHANTHGLILTWEGSVPASEAKPILMLAHQDVVPVLPDTVGDWTHPPYEGFYDGEIIWGRGATDDKGYLISLLESVDLLMKSGFRPKRTVILAFGCDEEISGENCGRPIADFLHERYGDDGIYMIMDEGSMGVQKEFDQSFAMVSVAEKGYLDVGINITSSGGHASTPPDHNVIGILSEIIVAIENSPFPGRVTSKNPMFGFLECAAAHAPPASLTSGVRENLGRVARGDVEAQEKVAWLLDDSLRYYFRTSQSVGKINGGVKINAIPELASTMINLRLAVETSVAQVKEHYESLIRPIAQRHGMHLEGFSSSGYDSPEQHRRKISLYSVDDLEPAPVSPVDAEAFRVLSGTIRNTLHPLGKDGSEELIVTPYLMPANTDTKFFWAVSSNIYRFTPINLVHSLNRAHTTDEFIRADEFVREPLFFATLILNADDAVGVDGS